MYKNNSVLVGKNFNNYINILFKQNNILKNKKNIHSNFFLTFLNYIYKNIIEPNFALSIILFFIFIFLLYRYNRKLKNNKKNKNNSVDYFDSLNTDVNTTYNDDINNINYNNNKYEYNNEYEYKNNEYGYNYNQNYGNYGNYVISENFETLKNDDHNVNNNMDDGHYNEIIYNEYNNETID